MEERFRRASRRFAPYPTRGKRKKRENAVSEGESPQFGLLYAADAETVRAVFSHAPWLAHTDDAVTALYYATQRNKPDVVGAMLAAGVDSTRVCTLSSPRGCTPLHMAASKGFTECLQLLLAAGADVNARHSLGGVALQLATFRGHVDCVRTLVKSGALVNVVCNDGLTPLHLAVLKRHATCLTVLLQAGADSKLRDRRGHEPICYAWTSRDFETVRKILGYHKNAPSSSIGCGFPKCKIDMEQIKIFCSLCQSRGP